MNHDWDLIERLLHEANASADQHFTPRVYAEDLTAERNAAGEPVGSIDHLKQRAADYEADLLHGDFIAPRPEEEGGNGENFVLTERGRRLLGLIDGSRPDCAEQRMRLDALGESALSAETPL